MPHEAATAWWKRMSWRRKSCGLSSDANMLVTSSAMAATCSPVARVALRPATPTSISRRASNISSRVKPCSAARKCSGSALEGRRTVGDEGARAVPRMDDAHRGQRTQADAHRRAADARLQRPASVREAGDRRDAARRARAGRGRVRRWSRRHSCGDDAAGRQPRDAARRPQARQRVSPASASSADAGHARALLHARILYHKCDGASRPTSPRRRRGTARRTLRAVRRGVSIARRTAS